VRIHRSRGWRRFCQNVIMMRQRDKMLLVDKTKAVTGDAHTSYQTDKKNN
jgi:hypothetical protein